MKKCLISFLLILLFPCLSFGAAAIGKMDGVGITKGTTIGGKTGIGKAGGLAIKAATNWYTGADFACGWEGGSDEQNTGGAGSATGDGVWSGVGAGAEDSRNTTTPLEGSADYKNEAVEADNTSYVYFTVTDQGILGVRFRINLTTNGLSADGDDAYFVQLRDGATIVAYARFINDTGTLKINVRCRNAANTSTVLVGSDITISAATEYQFEMEYRDGTGVTYKVYNATGTQVGTTQTRTTDYLLSALIDQVRFGSVTQANNITGETDWQGDNFRVDYDGLQGPE